MAATRRLAAILAADVVGYSRLMGADEEGTLAALKALRYELSDPKINEHHGRIVKTTGDGLLVEFGSVVDAVRCAVEVQAAMAERNAYAPTDKRIEFRIGINLGDIIIEDDDIFGDGVNIAARLEALAMPGGICVSRVVRDQVRDRLDIAFDDLGEQQVKNIVRPLRVFSINLGRRPAGLPAGVEHAAAASTPVAPPGPPRLSIVVLPFANIGGDPEQEYFADGITESLTTDLSRISGSFVIGRSTAFTYKGKPVDLKHIGRDLNVRYALEGSVQRGGDRLRVNVQLIDTETGKHLWAERFDKPLADLFDMQDEIVAHLANQLGTQLVEVEARRAERSPNPDSMDLYFRGMAQIHKGLTAENCALAENLLDRAIALDPTNADALAGKAWVNGHLVGVFLTDDRATRVANAEETTIRALSIAPNHPLAHFVLGVTYVLINRNAQAIEACEHALALDRNLANAHAMIGIAKTALGRAEEAEAHIREALRLSPRDVMAYHWMASAGSAKLHHGDYDEAVIWLRRSIEANRNLSFAHFSLAAALAHLDRMDEARVAAAAGLALEPTFTIGRYRAGARSDNAAYLVGRERAYQGMRKAGVPE